MMDAHELACTLTYVHTPRERKRERGREYLDGFKTVDRC